MSYKVHCDRCNAITSAHGNGLNGWGKVKGNLMGGREDIPFLAVTWEPAYDEKSLHLCVGCMASLKAWLEEPVK